jgi:hypothetical protein
MRREVHDWIYNAQVNWKPGSREGMLVDYIMELHAKIARLEKFQSDEMWRRDQASEHRMGL